MPIRHFPSRVGFIVSLLLSLAHHASALVILSDSFNDNDRSTQSLPNSATWYLGRAGTTGTTGNLAITPVGSGTSFIGWANFGTQSLTNIGDSIVLSFDFSAANIAGSSEGLRFALLSSEGTALSADITGTSDAAFNADKGYGVFYGLRNSNLTDQYSILERTGGNNALFTASAGGFAVLGSKVPATTTNANAIYNASLSITLSGAGEITLQSALNGNTITRTDISTLRSTFDTVAFFSDGNNGAITFDNITVTVVPEPTGMAFLFYAASLLLARHRRSSMNSHTSPAVKIRS